MQAAALQVDRLHRVMQHGGDGVGKNAVGMVVQRLQRLRHGGDLYLCHRVDVLVKNESDLLFLHLPDLIAVSDVALDKTGTCVQLERGARIQPAFHVDRALGHARFVDLVLVEHAEVFGLKQVVPAPPGKRELLARKGVDITQAHAVKAVGAVDLDKLAERLVELRGKILPMRVAHRGQGDEILCQAELVAAVVGDKGVVVYCLRPRAVHCGQLLHLALIAREGGADDLLKIGRLARINGENGGKAQLADDFDELIFTVSIAAVVGRDHDAVPPKKFCINYRGNAGECQIARGEKNLPAKNAHMRVFLSQTTLAIPNHNTLERPTTNQKGVINMATKNNNKLNVPEAKAAMNKFKMEAASEVGVNLKEGYNGDLTSREAGSVGGQMVKKMIESYEKGL